MWHKICFLIIFLIKIGSLFCLSVGSDSAVSRQPSIEFPYVDSDNEMNGFAVFEDGISLMASAATVTFDSFFPLSGSVNFKGGTICLAKDLYFDSDVDLVNFGSIYGGGRKVFLSESITTVTSFASGSIEASPVEWSTVASVNIGVASNSLDWFYNDNYIVSQGNQSIVSVYQFTGSSLNFVASASLKRTGLSVATHPTAYYFVVGDTTLSSRDTVELFKFVSNNITKLDGVSTGNNVTAVGWSHNGNYIAIGGYSDTRVFQFSNELLVAKGTLILSDGERTRPNAICWDQTGNYYVLGLGYSDKSKLKVYNFTGSSIVAKASVATSSDYVEAVDWSKTGSWIAMGTSGSSNQLRVYTYNSSTNVLTLTVQISVGGGIRYVHWDDLVNNLLVGKSTQSGGTELRLYKFDKVNSTLTLEYEEEVSTNVNKVRWSHNGNYFSYGTSAYNCVVCSYSPSVPASSYFSDSVFLDNVGLVFKDDLSWMMATTIRGDTVIDGLNNRIMIEGDGVITVTAGAQLTLKNVDLFGLSEQRLRCVSDNASIVLQDCKVRLGEDFLFSQGSLFFKGDVFFTGTNKFIYASNQTSTIDSKSNVVFDFDTTFKYAPLVSSRDLLSMVDESSGLCFNGSMLHASSVGFRLTKGTLWLDNAVTFSAEGVGNSQAICFGNGIESGDLTVRFLSDVDITIDGPVCSANVN